MSERASVPKVKFRLCCSCFNVSMGIKVLSIINIAIWFVFTFETFMESNSIMFTLAFIGCLYNLLICGYVSITTSKLSSYFMSRPFLVILTSTLNILLSLVMAVLAHTKKPEWELGGEIAHVRVSNM